MNELVQMRADLKRVARECGLPDGVAPSRWSYSERGCFKFWQIQALTGTWVGSVRRLGFRPVGRTPRSSAYEIVRDVRRVAEELGHAPLKSEYARLGRFATSTAYKRVAGRWSAILAASGLNTKAGAP